MTNIGNFRMNSPGIQKGARLSKAVAVYAKLEWRCQDEEKVAEPEFVSVVSAS